MLNRPCKFVLAIAPVLFVAPLAHAVTVFDSLGFENTSNYSQSYTNANDPTAVGTTTGQDNGPQSTTTVTGGWAQSPILSTGSAAANGFDKIVSNPFPAPFAGTQALQVTRQSSNTTNDLYFYPHVEYAVTAPNQIVNINWSAVIGKASPDGTNVNQQFFGPFVGINAVDDTGTFTNIGAFGVDASTGLLQYRDASGKIQFLPGSPTIAFNAPNSYQLSLNYSTHTYNVLLNGVQENASPLSFVSTASTSTTLSDADISVIQNDFGGHANFGDTSYFDNYNIVAVPEPATAGLLCIGGLGMLSRRRKVQNA